MMQSKFDIVIFGATGCVGKYVVLEALNVLEGLNWAIAGHSKDKMLKIVTQIYKQTSVDLTCLPMLIADATDLESIVRMVEQCKVLVNCCGPYQLWAEVIIKACIRYGTHYVDMCNDPYFNELMELRYSQRAMENNVYIISSCGFNSFPIEMALNYIQQNFKGTVNYVDSYLRFHFARQSFFPICPMLSNSAWTNMIWHCAMADEMPWLREELREIPLPTLLPKQPRNSLFHRPPQCDDAVYLRFPYVDKTLVERSQYHLYLNKNTRPMQFYQYVEFPSFFWAILFLIWFLLVSILAQYMLTRNLLLAHPVLFSLGVCSSCNPCKSIMRQYSSYKILLKAKGWSPNPTLSANERSNGLNTHMYVEISGKQPVYGCGCLCLLLSARCVLEEMAKLPGCGGVIPPGYAFYRTNILRNLMRYPDYVSIRQI